MIGVVAAFAIALGWAGLAIWLGPAIGWVDRPEADTELKVHERPAVPLGGVGIFLGVHIAMAATDRFDAGLAVATGMVLLLGLVDDRISLSPKLRLVVEVAAGVVLVGAADVGVHGWGGFLVGTALVVFAINAVNLYDGLDGLVGSTAMLTSLGLAALAEWGRVTGDWTVSFSEGVGDPSFPGLDPLFGLILAGALAGFLFLNWNPAKVFLGDNGAYTVAVLIAYGILRTHSTVVPDGPFRFSPAPGPNVSVAVWIAMGLLGVFALDLVVTFARRRLDGKPLFEGDRSHVYDQLRDRGMSIKRIALTSSGLQAFLVAVTVAVDRWIGGWWAVAVLVLVAVALLATARARGFLARAE